MRAASATVCPLLLSACVLQAANEDDPSEAEPIRDQWRVELSAPLTMDGAGQLSELRVGGTESDGNFANRGDVIVRFHDEDRIVVEMRRFTRALSQDRAQQDFDRLSLWAYIGGDVAPMRPSEMEFPRPCVGQDGTFLDRCGLRVYFDGQSQPLRTGADLRVTLPARYAGALDIITEDSIVDADYLNRGNVCIEPTRARVSVQLERGVALGSIAPASVAPQAVPEISMRGDAADLWLDVPAQLRTAFELSYEADARKQEQCFADPQLSGHVIIDSTFGSTRSTLTGVAGPDPEAVEHDATLWARAETCDVVAFTEAPEQWSGEPDEQSVETRGVLHLCNDCLRDAGCEALLPGG